jgi:hypothetical protein
MARLKAPEGYAKLTGNAPVAQLDRASAYEQHENKTTCLWVHKLQQLILPRLARALSRLQGRLLLESPRKPDRSAQWRESIWA